jgi:hypothetical protein
VGSFVIAFWLLLVLFLTMGFGSYCLQTRFVAVFLVKPFVRILVTDVQASTDTVAIGAIEWVESKL